MGEQHHHPKPTDSVVLRKDVVRSGERGRLGFVIIVTGVVMAAELVGGILTGSLSLLSDALHMLTHLGAAGLSWIAIVIASRPAAPEKTYRNWRFEVLAALFNGLAFLPLAAFIVHEAWQRWRHPVGIDVVPMLAVAGVGLAANLVCAGALHRHSVHDVNLRAAFLHLVADTLSSVAVVAAGLVVWAGGPAWVDPMAAALIGLLVSAWSLGLIRASVRILLESAPHHIDLEKVRGAIAGFEGVTGVHDLHVWTITSKMYALTAHVALAEDLPVSKCQELSDRMTALLDGVFDINHVTLQFETSEHMAACCEHDATARSV